MTVEYVHLQEFIEMIKNMEVLDRYCPYHSAYYPRSQEHIELTKDDGSTVLIKPALTELLKAFI